LKCGTRNSARLGRPTAEVANHRDHSSHQRHHDEAKPSRHGCNHISIAAQSKKHEVGTMSNIAERVKKIVVEHLGVEPDKVTEQASFIDDLGADSLDTVELVMAFEEEFGCEIPDDAAETILTVGDAVKFLEKNAKS
jgi:acyl carrier protein